VAVLLNVFDKILLALDRKNIPANLPFLLTLVTGGAVGVFLFSKFITALLYSYETYIYYCFIGIIIGCLPVIYKRARYNKVKLKNISVFFIGLSFMIFLAAAGGGAGLYHTLTQIGTASPVYYLWLFFAMCVSAAVIILPGVSGAVILLLFGVYPIAMEVISTLHLPLLSLMAAGALTGGVMGILVLKKMLKSHPQALYFAILGLIIGSIFSIYPGFTMNHEGILCVILAIVFMFASYAFSRKAYSV